MMFVNTIKIALQNNYTKGDEPTDYYLMQAYI